MSLPLLFQKFKSLSPIAFVGVAVAITIKLLTAQTPSLQDSLNVNAEEDIAKVAYEDEIELPKPTEEEQEEPISEESPEEENQETEEAGEEDSGDSQEQESQSQEEEEKKQEEKKKEEQKGRQWKNDSKNPVISLLKKLTQKQ